MENNAISSKIKANAVSAYLLLFVCIFFLFNKENKYLNNPFVKSHVKTAFSIHLGFLITYIIFVSSGLFSSLSLYSISLNEIITKTLFLTLLGGIILGMYRANNGKNFWKLEIFKFSKSSPEKIIDINGDGKFGEKDKLTILISYIPFVGFLNYAKFYKNSIIRNNTKLNLIITIIIFLLSIFSHNNLVILFILFYTIFVVFTGINMFSRNEIISFNLSKIPTFKELSYIVKSLGGYISNYFGDKEFISLNKIIKKKIDTDLQIEKKELLDLKEKKECRIPSFLIYIPYINLIFLFIKNTRYSFHIRNGITITVLLIILQIATYLGYYNSAFTQLLIIPILFGIGYSKSEPIYKMAFIYDLYELFQKTVQILGIKTKQVNEIRKKETGVSLKVK